MLPSGFVAAAYLIAAVCFMYSLGGLSRHETARRGNLLGIIGIALAITATIFSGLIDIYSMLFVALGIGFVIGAIVASRVQMTVMPQLVALLHSFVGLAAVLVGISSFLHHPDSVYRADPSAVESGAALTGALPAAPGELAATSLAAGDHSGPGGAARVIRLVEIFLGVFIGGVTFTGSVIAWGKLQGTIRSRPMMLPGRHGLNLAMVILCLILGLVFIVTGSLAVGLTALVLIALLSFVVGAHLVMAIGGADMPVVVSMLNSYSGWAAAATGFMLSNDLLIITGALVGSSGAILSYIMCRAMNRSFISVILGGFGVESGTVVARTGDELTYGTTSSEETARWLAESREVIVVPGYGMAVAQAQHPIREITELLRQRGVRTRFAIHPVAGRLPGHMNVLLAEARIPYDVVLEMDHINGDFAQTDVVLVIGANDIVNPGALDDPTSPIYGMPVLEAWKAKRVVVLKRSMATGYSGIDNPLFYRENTMMLFGDARSKVDEVLSGLKQMGSG